jgi:hypothetical protein
MLTKIEVDWNHIKIYMNDVLHVLLKKEELVGIQAWIEGHGINSTYHIKYYMKNKIHIKSEYWDIQHWQEVLRVLDQQDLFSLST